MCRKKLWREKGDIQEEPDIAFYVPKGVFSSHKKTAETLKLVNFFAPGMNREEHEKKLLLQSHLKKELILS